MRKSRPLTRVTNRREPKTVFTILTEGKNTEPEYFRELQRIVEKNIIRLDLVPAAGAPVTIANLAKAQQSKSRELGRHGKKRSFAQQDETWVAFDRDEHPNIDEAIQICKNAKVGVAFSNPCFELWLILHLADFDKVVDRHKLQAECEKICPGYDKAKGKKADVRAIVPCIEEAEKRAERQHIRRMKEGKVLQPPFTTVYELTRRIRGAH